MRKIGTLALVVALGALVTLAPAATASAKTVEGPRAGSAVLQLLARLVAPILGDAQAGRPEDGASAATSSPGNEQDAGPQTDPDG